MAGNISMWQLGRWQRILACDRELGKWKGI